MSNVSTQLAYLQDSTRYPKVEVTPVTVPTVQVTNVEWNYMTEVIADHDERIDTQDEVIENMKLRAITVGFDGVDKAGHVMTLEDGDVVWNEAGNDYNVCGTLDVSSGDTIYLSTYNIGGYEALSWAVVNSGGTVVQSADATVEAQSETGETRIDVTSEGTLYVYMQYNYGIPTIKKVTSEDYDAEKTEETLSLMATFNQTPMVPTITTSAYINNLALLKGYIQDAVFSGGNSNNGVYAVSVVKGGVYKIVNAGLGGYGGLYWTIINDEGIVQHGEGSNQSLSDDVVVVAVASGTLYVSFGYYDSSAEEYVRPSIYELADMNERYDGIKNSIKAICSNSLMEESDEVTTTTGKYIMVEDGVVQINSGGNANNGYMSISLSAGDVVKVSGACSSSYSSISWVLADTDGNVLEYSGVLGYSVVSDDFLLVAGEDATLYVGFGYYDSSTESYPKPTIYTLANQGETLEDHEEEIETIDKTLYRRYVPFDGYSAPMIVRYGDSSTLQLDTDYGNAYNKCHYIAVTAGQRFLLKGASTGGYDGVAWAVFSDGSAVQQSSTETATNTVFDDCIIKIEQDGTLYVNNFAEVDDDLCELYTIEESELEGNLQTKPLVFGGDSTMQGLASQFESSMLERPRRVFKMGVGSESVYATAARMGAIPLLCMPVTIPASATAVEVSVTPRPLFKQTYDSDGVPETPAVQNEYVCPAFTESAHFYCSIGGIEGNLYTDSDTGTTYFLRSEAGTALTISTPVEVVPLEAERIRNSLLVCLMGTNGGYLNYDADYDADDSQWGSQTDSQRAQNLFDVMKRMFAYMGGEMIVIGFFCGESQSYFTEAFYEEYEALCEKEFGEKFINARLWLKDYAWQEMGLTLTDTDKTYMAAGYPPVQLFDDNTAIHLSDAANAVFAQYVADRISHLGY